MKECLLLYIYKDNREFNIDILKEVYEESVVFFTDRILVLDLSKIEWDNIFPAVKDFNSGQFMVTHSRSIHLLRFFIRNKYKILEISFYKHAEKTQKLIDEILEFINSDDVNLRIKGKFLELLKEEFDYEENENDNYVKSIKVKLESSYVEFYDCTRIRIDDSISQCDIDVIKTLLDSISD